MPSTALVVPRRDEPERAYRLIVEGACDHRPVRRMVCMEAMARASSAEAFNDVLATIVRADEVVGIDAERIWSGEHLGLKRPARGRRA